MAADHLLERGFRRFSFCGYPGENWSRRREEGFVERLREAGFDCDSFESPKQSRACRGDWSSPLSLGGSSRCKNPWGFWRATTSADAPSDRSLRPRRDARAQ